MRGATLIGLVLIVLGALGLLYQGITYTRREEVIEIGPLEAEVEQRETIPIPPWLSIVVLGAGVALVIVGRQRRG